MFKGNFDASRANPLFDSHYYCDYIELLALVNDFDIVSSSDVKSRFTQDQDLSVDNDGLSDQGSENYSEDSDVWDSHISQWFELLNHRMGIYGDIYPFDINRGTIRFKREISNARRMYVFFLCCSLLDKFRKSEATKLTFYYEAVCERALKEYLPKKSEVYIFGKSSYSAERYTGSKFSKIDKLAHDLNMKHVFEAEDYPKTDTGDSGVDLVAWNPFKDDLNKSKCEVYICQCATGKDWLRKQLEPNKILEPIPELRHARKTIFVPYELRSSNGKFFHERELTTQLIFDRFRISKLINGKEFSVFRDIPSLYSIINEVISYKDGLV